MTAKLLNHNKLLTILKNILCVKKDLLKHNLNPPPPVPNGGRGKGMEILKY